ncbi:MAG: sugar ABC transporter ATP-binding protein [Planctomycetes bacterium]|nr:sugar ABC transporter ATP-binding protein [Planctomycetota bacterium]
MTQPVISINRISKRFGGTRALHEVSFDVMPGELHAICGENGAGKSTLMKILSGVITSYEGELLIDGDVVHFSGTKDAESVGISIIHQELNLVEQLSVAANIFLGRELRNGLFLRDDRAMEAQAADLLESLDCDIPPDRLAGSLRVGDQQLIEIAKALSINSRILVMDEPTSALTESEVERLYRVIAKLRSQGTTILYISHKMEEVFHLSDRITVLRDGQFIATRNTKETTPGEITKLMVGRDIESLELGPRSQRGELVLEVRNLSLEWPGHARGYRLKDISLELYRGEVLGIAGLMGAGRTELLECLFGASTLEPTGEILLEGYPIKPRHPADAKQAGLALVTEDRKRLGIFNTMNVGRNISMCSLRDAAIGPMLNSYQEEQLSESMVEKLRIKTAGLTPPIGALSGGNQQKCIVGRWLLTGPKVLLLDDPTRGVDVGAKAELYRVIRSLCAEGLGVIVTSSELPELLTISDRIMVLSEGRKTAEFRIEDATQEKIMEAATKSWQSHEIDR